MWWVNEIVSRKAVLVRYSNVLIVDRRRDDEYNTQVEDLYDMEFTDSVKNYYPLSKDPVWKNLCEKFGRLGYDLKEPDKVTRIEKVFNVGSEFCWDFSRYDEEQAKAEEDGVLCLPS